MAESILCILDVRDGMHKVLILIPNWDLITINICRMRCYHIWVIATCENFLLVFKSYLQNKDFWFDLQQSDLDII